MRRSEARAKVFPPCEPVCTASSHAGPVTFPRHYPLHPAGRALHAGGLPKSLCQLTQRTSAAPPATSQTGWRALPFEVGTSKSPFKETKTHLGTNAGTWVPALMLIFSPAVSSIPATTWDRGALWPQGDTRQRQEGEGALSPPRGYRPQVRVSCTSASSPDQWAALTSCQGLLKVHYAKAPLTPGLVSPAPQYIVTEYLQYASAGLGPPLSLPPEVRYLGVPVGPTALLPRLSLPGDSQEQSIAGEGDASSPQAISKG